MTQVIRIPLLVAWGLGLVRTAHAIYYGVSSQPWLIAVVWGLPIGWIVAWRIRHMDLLVDDHPPLLHPLMLASLNDENAMHGFNALVTQAIAAIVILCGTIATIRLGYEFPWYNGLITLGACTLAQYFDLHFQHTTSTESIDTGRSAGPDGTF
jgi:hypothetical protein